MWLVLGIPHFMERLRTRRESRAVSRSGSVSDLFTSEVFGCRHTFQFFAIAFATNFAYIAALDFLPASLNTAVFSTSSIFTLGLTLVFLKNDAASTGFSLGSACLRFLCIGLSML